MADELINEFIIEVTCCIILLYYSLARALHCVFMPRILRISLRHQP